ncbi:unnamed protein product [Penicillium salamii]|uniref:Rhodopsin domain-containing protein n=1 Tax=Penicillium salamii TaxID=1612424 RepID=A0A9W4NMD1_9EURO|nr:unnamed protein product [Penicillium salamii]CAG8369312.1 unnamed protein product [Penicillium salamii]CAG8384926.1 unnamed protein product [Penicillium salamii]
MNITTIFGPPPAGVNLNDNRVWKDNTIVAVLCALAFITVLMRYFVRLYLQGMKLGADDFFVGASVVVLVVLVSISVFSMALHITKIGMILICITGGHHGLGRHVWSTTLEHMVTIKKGLFAYVLIYLVELLLIKVSILMFYRRVFNMNWMIWTCLIFSCCWCTGSMIAALSAPKPISYFWSEMISPSSGIWRYNFYYYYIGNATSNVVLDVLIFMTPIPVVWKLQMRTGQKIAICSLFLLGGFVCVASIVRIHYLTFLNGTEDVTWTLSEVAVWSVVEPAIGIICACLPYLQPLIRSTIRKIHSQRSRTGRISSSIPKLNASQRHTTSKRSDQHEAWHGQAQQGHSRSKPLFISDDDCMRLTALSTRVEMEDSNDRESLEGNLDPMSIRVKKDVHWTVG